MKDKIRIIDYSGQLLIALIPFSLLIGTAISESLILMLVIMFLTKIITTRNTKIFKNLIFFLLIIIWITLLLNSFFALDLGVYTLRNITFFKYILVTAAFFLFFQLRKNIIYYAWLLTLIIVIIDIYFEFFIGHNLIGMKAHDPNRIASFLGKELKIAHFVTGFGFLCLSFFIELKKNNSNKYQFIYSLILLIIITSIFITGERANFIKGLIMTIILVNFIIKNYAMKVITTFSIIFLISISIISFEKIENRFSGQVTKIIYEKGFIKYFKESQHGAHFDVAIQILKKYPIFGIGNKNFRIECQKEEYYNPSYKLSSLRCSTHPHQVYYELLSEHGIFGTLVIISVFFYIIFKNFIIYNMKKNLIHLSSILFIAVTFLPIIPSGSFFASFGATIFWINFSIMCYYYIKFYKKNK